MPCTPILKRPKGLDVLPHVLAGPTLRQVTPTSVTVWFALRTQSTMQSTIKVTVFDGSANPPSNQSKCAPVGTNLFFSAVTVSLSTSTLMTPFLLTAMATRRSRKTSRRPPVLRWINSVACAHSETTPNDR
jgi:hypothetical protein